MSTLKNSVHVLRCFTPSRPELTVTEVATWLGLPKSNVSRLLRAMHEAGMLDAAGRGRGYRLGEWLQDLGQMATQTQTFHARASAAARRVSEQMGHSGYVSVLVGTHMVGLAHHVGGNAQQVGVPLGARLPVDACATGRAMLATMSDTEVRQLLGGRVSLAAAQSPRDFDDLIARLQQTREQGFAQSQHEASPGGGALAVAVADPQTGERLCLCLTYPIEAMSPAERKQAIELLLQERRNLTRSHS